MIFPGPALQLGHKARPVVTGLGVSVYVFEEIVEVGPSKPTYPSREVLDRIVGDYPERLQPGKPELEVVAEMHLNREEVVLPAGEIEWHPTQPQGTLIGKPDSCDKVLGRKPGSGIGRRVTRLPRRRK